MNAKELWNYLGKNGIEKDGSRYPKRTIKIKGKELDRVSCEKGVYKVWIKCCIPYSLYGTPEESTTYKFALALQKEFGFMKNITDKNYIVNSYHVDPREQINAFKKLDIEGSYLDKVTGGAVSYVETYDLTNNPEVIETLFRYMYDHIAYAEINRIVGVCYKCGYNGTINLSKTADGEFVFKCPNCGNTDDALMNVIARICGYIGKVNAGETNKGRLDDIFHRTVNFEFDVLEQLLEEINHAA